MLSKLIVVFALVSQRPAPISHPIPYDANGVWVDSESSMLSQVKEFPLSGHVGLSLIFDSDRWDCHTELDASQNRIAVVCEKKYSLQPIAK